MTAFSTYRPSRNGVEIPTTDLFMPIVLDMVPCDRHRVELNVPCFQVPKKDESGYFPGICNHRAKRAGFDAPIRPQSLDRSLNPGRSGN